MKRFKKREPSGLIEVRLRVGCERQFNQVFCGWAFADGHLPDRKLVSGGASQNWRSQGRGWPGDAIILLIVLGAVLLLSGCAVGPDYKRPVVDTPGNYRFDTQHSTNSFGDLPWWEAFQNPILVDLIATAVTNNYNLKQAVARVEQTRNLSVAARSPLFPQIGYGGGVGRGRNAFFNSPAVLDGATESSAQANLNAFWEIDLWGRIRRLTEAARAEYLATDEARRAVTLSLVSEVATAYFQLLQYDQELAIQQSATNAYGASFRLFEDRLKNGAASKLETDRAAALANAASIIPRFVCCPLQFNRANAHSNGVRICPLASRSWP